RRDEAGERAAPLHRTALASEPERGLSDRASARAGPDRPRGARRLELATAPAARGLGRARGELRAVLSRELHQLPALRRGKAPIDVPDGDGQRPGRGTKLAQAWHRTILADRS